MPGGRPKGRKVTQALEAANEATVSIQKVESVVSRMSERQRAFFESVMAGENEVVSILRGGYENCFTGITKVLYLKDKTPINSDKITVDNVDDLEYESYFRILTICQSRVKQIMGKDDYREVTEPIKEYIKRFAPLALGTVVGIAQHGVKEENRLKAAKDILDRAGETAQVPEKDVVVPVQVNIMLTNQDGSVTRLG